MQGSAGSGSHGDRADAGDEGSWPGVRERVRECFGVAKFFLAHEFPQDLGLIREALRERLPELNFRSFVW